MRSFGRRSFHRPHGVFTYALRFCTNTPHVDSASGLPRMVNVADKRVTRRTAVAQSRIYLPPGVVDALGIGITTEVSRGQVSDEEHQRSDTTSKSVEFVVSPRKGPVVATAVVAGTMAVKKTSELIPFCHAIPIESCRFNVMFDVTRDRRVDGVNSSLEPRNQLVIDCEVVTEYKTGVEMEALTGASVAALTVYDMIKGVAGAQENGLRICGTELLRKTGGKSDVSRVASRDG